MVFLLKKWPWKMPKFVVGLIKLAINLINIFSLKYADFAGVGHC